MKTISRALEKFRQGKLEINEKLGSGKRKLRGEQYGYATISEQEGERLQS